MTWKRDWNIGSELPEWNKGKYLISVYGEPEDYGVLLAKDGRIIRKRNFKTRTQAMSYVKKLKKVV